MLEQESYGVDPSIVLQQGSEMGLDFSTMTQKIMTDFTPFKSFFDQFSAMADREKKNKGVKDFMQFTKRHLHFLSRLVCFSQALRYLR